MSTRSAIAKKTELGYEWIYCHFDGYPENQEPLLKNYDTEEKVNELLSLKCLSYLGSEIGEKQNFAKPTNRNWCLSYWRDRGEESIAPYQVAHMKYLKEDAMNSHCEWLYVYENGKWVTIEL
jgi:hypothetical protein